MSDLDSIATLETIAELEARIRAIEAERAVPPPPRIEAPIGPQPGTWEHELMLADERRRKERSEAARAEEERARIEREAAEEAERQRRLRNAPEIARLEAKRAELIAARQPHLDRAAPLTRQIEEVDREIEGLR